jgi:hypothetical protein
MIRSPKDDASNCPSPPAPIHFGVSKSPSGNRQALRASNAWSLDSISLQANNGINSLSRQKTIKIQLYPGSSITCRLDAIALVIPVNNWIG